MGESLSREGFFSVLLDYAPAEKTSPVSRWLRAVPVLISLPAIAVIFLPFLHEISPWDVVWAAYPLPKADELALLGAPFFLAFPLFLFGLRRLISPRLFGVELAIVWLVVGVAASATIYFDGISLSETSSHNLCDAMSLAIMIAGATLLFFNRRRIAGAEISLLAIYLAYLSNAFLCLAGFYDEQGRGPGWYTTIVVAALMMLEIIGRLTIFRRFNA